MTSVVSRRAVWRCSGGSETPAAPFKGLRCDWNVPLTRTKRLSKLSKHRTSAPQLRLELDVKKRQQRSNAFRLRDPGASRRARGHAARGPRFPASHRLFMMSVAAGPQSSGKPLGHFFNPPEGPPSFGSGLCCLFVFAVLGPAEFKT